MDYLSITPSKCDCCGERVASFYDKGNWWGKYLKPGEKKICLACIKNRGDFRRAFQEIIGIPLDEMPR